METIIEEKDPNAIRLKGRYERKYVEKFCTYCHRTERHELVHLPGGKYAKPIALKAMPDRTMICKECEQIHGHKHQIPAVTRAEVEANKELDRILDQLGI